MNKILARTLVSGIASIGLVAGVSVSAQASASYQFSCDIPTGSYASCSSDNWVIAPNKKVYLAVNTSGGKSIRFKLYNKSGHHLLADHNVWQKPGSGYYYIWTNNTSSNITVDVEADANSNVARVDAVNHVNIV